MFPLGVRASMNIYRHEDDYAVKLGSAEEIKLEECRYEDEIDSIFEKFDRLFNKGDFERADEIIEEFLKRDLHLKIAMLTATLPAQSKLKNRQRLYTAVLLGPYDQIDDLLKGL